ncbi:MAG: PDZ domain-containing protein [Pirellulales bacterium]
MPLSKIRNLFVFSLLVSLPAGVLSAQDDIELAEERAIKAAVEHVAGSVVSIETVGGLERSGQVLFGTGPTTGLIVSDDGYVVSSAFNFAQKPTSILVSLADGTRLPAQLVATDHSRMLVLLKVAAGEPLPVPEAAPAAQMMVGQWSIAVGRTFEGSQPNLSVGIVSALERIWGKALQTDAKISPANYGGPLVDIRGRVLGVLVPLSPTESGEVAGVEWYDSGIGFAIPLEHLNAVLPRLKAGDLKPGLLGISMSGRDVYSDPAVIAACRPNSPAYEAGLKSGDRIVSVEGRPIERQAQLLYEINRRYAGDTVALTVQRGDEQFERPVKLVDHLEPYQRAFLGILAVRSTHLAEPAAAEPPATEPRAADQPAAEPAGVQVRYVYPESPAAKAGLQAGDVISSFNEKPLGGRDELAEALAALKVAQQVPLAIRRGDETLSLEVELAAEPETVPDELPAPAGPAPAAEPEPADAEEAMPQRGVIALKVPEFQNDCLVYVPESYRTSASHGLVVWLHPAGGSKDDELVARWQGHCERLGLILIAPKAADPARWRREDIDFIKKAIDQLRQSHAIDPLRVAAVGQQMGGSLAYVLAFAHRDLVRGVAALDAPLGGSPPDNDPVYRLTFYVTKSGSMQAQLIDAAVKLLRDRKYAVVVPAAAQQAAALSDAELAPLLRWLDSLDRL